MLTPIPAIAQAVSVPRAAAIEFPLGRTLGRPGDITTQMAVLRAVLAALESIQTPGEIIHLPFEWVEDGKGVEGEPPEPPPIVRQILTHPWQLPRLLRRDPPNP
jgi:D-proline reductase (dithiol) PrdB